MITQNNVELYNLFSALMLLAQMSKRECSLKQNTILLIYKFDLSLGVNASIHVV